MEAPAPSQAKSGAFIGKLGAWLQLAPFIAIAAIFVGRRQPFAILKMDGSGDPASLSAAIMEALGFLSVAVALSQIGIVLVAVAITALRYRAGWMWRFLCLYGLAVISIHVCVLLIGHFTATFYLLAALFFLIFALVRKDEFVRASQRRPLPACYSLDE